MKKTYGEWAHMNQRAIAGVVKVVNMVVILLLFMMDVTSNGHWW